MPQERQFGTVFVTLCLLHASSLAAEVRSLREAFADPDSEYRPLVIMHSQPLRDARAVDDLAAPRGVRLMRA